MYALYARRDIQSTGVGSTGRTKDSDPRAILATMRIRNICLDHRVARLTASIAMSRTPFIAALSSSGAQNLMSLAPTYVGLPLFFASILASLEAKSTELFEVYNGVESGCESG